MKKIISSPDAPKAVGPYSQAVEANGTLYISGQLPIDPSTGKFAEGGAAEQTKQCLKNVEAILKEAGYSFSDVVKSTVLMANMDDFALFNEVYGKYFKSENAPARSTVAVKTLPKNVLVEVEVIAYKN